VVDSPSGPGGRVTDELLELVKTLRSKDGCPWDRKQTPRTMASYLTEELYELLDAIELNHPEHVCEELGDLLFHILFITHLYAEKNLFDLEDVASACLEKMIRRHPHVFGEKTLNDAEEVKNQWHCIKMKEKQSDPQASITDSVSTRLPALMRAYRISERVARTGFDWDSLTAVIEKLEEELAEFKFALSSAEQTTPSSHHAAMELGDILFTLVNVARFLNIQPESALRDATRKFERRFKSLEKMAAAEGKKISALSSREMDRYWEKAKGQAE